ncbi:MAG: RimK/LysX family protein [Candidatus Saccharimonadales bacterium]
MVVTKKTTAALPVVGTTEFLVLPENSDAAVLAKIDTGADGSSIWASDIEEHEGELSFVLFAPHSSFYTGHVIKTSRYRVTRVKNSFGIEEFRYRVWLKIEFAGKRYRASFTLANRSNSRFPILIGKRFLNKRFLVDVSRSNIITPEKTRSNDTVVVLCSVRNAQTREFFDGVAREGNFDLELAHYRDLAYNINDQGVPMINLPDGTDIACASLVYFKDYQKSYQEQATAIARYLQYRHVDFIDSEVASAISTSKLSELFILAIGGVSVPASTWITHGLTATSYDELSKIYSSTFVLKNAFADRGRDNVLVRSVSDFEEATHRLSGSKLTIAQRYIVSDGYYRVVVMAHEPIQVVYRKSVQHGEDSLRDHLNKPVGSANAIEIDIDKANPEMITIATRAAIVMRRDIAGVDILQDRQTGQWYVIEVNYNPSMFKGINQKHKQRGLANTLKTMKGNPS